MKPFLSIKGRLLTFTLSISLIPIAIITTIYYLNARSTLKDRIFQDLRAIAESRALHVHYLMGMKKLRTVDFSTDGFIRNSLETIVRKNGYKQYVVTRLNRYLLTAKMPLYRHIQAIAVVNKHGKVVSSTNEKLIGNDVSAQDVFKQGISKGYGEACVGPPHYYPDLDANCIVIYAPIFSRRSNESLGVIVNAFNLSALNEITINRVGMGKTGEIYLVNRNKMMITESRFIAGAPLKQIVDTKPVRKMVENGEETVGIYPDYRGVPVVGLSMIIPEYGWTLLTEIDETEAFAPLRKLGSIALILGIVGAVVVLSVGITFTSLILRPKYYGLLRI